MALITGLEVAFIVLLDTEDTFRPTVPSPEEGLEKTFCFPEPLFSFSPTDGDFERSMDFVFFPLTAGTNVFPRGGPFLA